MLSPGGLAGGLFEILPSSQKKNTGVLEIRAGRRRRGLFASGSVPVKPAAQHLWETEKAAAPIN